MNINPIRIYSSDEVGIETQTQPQIQPQNNEEIELPPIDNKLPDFESDLQDLGVEEKEEEQECEMADPDCKVVEKRYTKLFGDPNQKKSNNTNKSNYLLWIAMGISLVKFF